MTKNIKLAIAGVGTVGQGVISNIENNAELIKKRSNAQLEIVGISGRDKNKKRSVDTNNYKWFYDAKDLVDIKDVDIIIELIGGSEGIAYDVVKNALQKGIDVVTANKALVASHGFELAKLAEENNAVLAYEAAVAGSIPAIKVLKESLSANNIQKVMGILNGTCNYILTEMDKTGKDFATILKDAQELGYAEADPTFDVDGIDTAHKLAILAAIAYSGQVDIKNIYIEGIRNITNDDIKIAYEMGYRIKLIGIATNEDGKVSQYIYPALLPFSTRIAWVDGVDNAVNFTGDYSGDILCVGAGAGSFATASSVMTDILDIVSDRKSFAFNSSFKNLEAKKFNSIKQRTGGYYLRIPVKDKTGIMAEITNILKENNISIENISQKDGGQVVPIIITTHKTTETNIDKAMSEIGSLSEVAGEVMMVRIES